MLDAVTERVGTKSRPLADPPAGSDLEPVMGEHGLPLLGKTVKMLRDGQANAVAFYEKYGPVFWNNAFGQKMVWVLGPEAAQEVLINKEKAFSQTGWEFFIGPFFNRGLMLLDGAGAPPAPPDHAGGLHPAAAGGLPRASRRVIDEHVPQWPTDEPMLDLPRGQVALPGHRDRGLHGRRAQPRRPSGSPQAFDDSVRAGGSRPRRASPVPGLRWDKGLRAARCSRTTSAPLSRRSGPPTTTTSSRRSAT